MECYVLCMCLIIICALFSLSHPNLGSYNCRMGWDTSSDFETSSLGSNGLVFKSVMVKTRKEKGKESELHVRTIYKSLLCTLKLENVSIFLLFLKKKLRFQKCSPKYLSFSEIAFENDGLILYSGCQ
jgi:hypothetical protein